MKEKMIKLFNLAGYDFIEEKPEGRLILYDAEQEQELQFWVKGHPNLDLKDAMEFIKERCYDIGISIGKGEVQNQIRKALGL